MRVLALLAQLSIIKSLRFNLHYFGWGGVKFPVLVSKNYRLKKLKGRVSLALSKPAVVRLGFSAVGIFDERSERGIWHQTGGEVRFEGRAFFGQGSRVSVGDQGVLTIGDGVCNTAMGSIICHKSVGIGMQSLISWNTLVMDTDFHRIDGKPVSLPVKIGNHVWIGCRSTILKGSFIPSHSVVAAQSVISKRFEKEGSVYGGVNTLIKEGISWQR